MTERLNILVVGSGGREHALAWKLAQSSRVGQVWIAPGNGGTVVGGGQPGCAPITNVPLSECDFEGLIRFAHQETIYLTVIGPEVPLAVGIVDAFQASGLRCFGPNQAAAQIEASKTFAKAFMGRHQIPTARYAAFTDYELALEHLAQVNYDVVIKASGLAAGKGVIVPDSRQAAEMALEAMLVKHTFGIAGDEIIIEERLYGQEASVLAFCDGQTVVPMPAAQDHKRVFDGDLGPNTGGMGAYAPPPVITPALSEAVMRCVLQPVIDGFQMEGTPFVGILFAGLMVTANGLRVLEYNCRFGDPEAQTVLPLLNGDLVNIFEACLDGKLDQQAIPWHSGAAATVVAASEGYPNNYPKGRKITGLDDVSAMPKVTVFHAGTHRAENGNLVTNGGRVLSVTGRGDTLQQALDFAYAGMAKINFAGMHYRRDIGQREF